MQSLYILGRQPEIGIAELESLVGADQLIPISPQAIATTVPPDYVPFERLGGSMKVCKPLTTLPYDDWQKIENYLLDSAPKYLQYLPDGKMHVGISVYGMKISPKRINVTALALKKVIKQTGKSIRIIPNVTAELNSAQVLRNKLTGPSGWELVLIADGNQTHLAQTIAVQDIDAYAARDQARPKRDARIGMLPPKLAQIIVNLASVRSNHFGATVLDPFCGTGVVLQEATLMGFDVYGSDLDKRMIEYTDTNLMWLLKQPNCPVRRPPETLSDPNWRYFNLEQADSTSHAWRKHFDFIAGETYLGRPFSSEPKPDALNAVVRDVDVIHRKFLQNIAKQTKPGFRMCIAVPAWKTGNGFKHLNVLASLEELGYTRQSFVHTTNEDLIYYRPDQIVGRELVVLTRK